MDESVKKRPLKLPQTSNKTIRIIAALLLLALITVRGVNVANETQLGADTWLRLSVSGLVIGSMYALIAIGYTLVYGILFMINFAHGEVMMIGSFGGYFAFELFNAIPATAADGSQVSFLNAYPVLAVFTAFLAGMLIAAVSGYFLEKIAYRPLRGAPRLVPLISAIGASIFLQNAGQLLFGPQRRQYINPVVLERGIGWNIEVAGSQVVLTYTGIFSLVLSAILMIGLFLLVQRTKLGRAMRAVAQDKKTAALMGINVDEIISRTFVISGALAGAAGVMWGIHNGLFNYFVGFIPGIKAFTAAVLGGIGNIPGAMIGGFFLGIIESIGPAILGIDFQLKDVLAFTILILVLIFRPSGILGEALTEEKL